MLDEFGSLSAITGATDEELRNCASKGESWVESFLVVRQLLFDGMREQTLRSRLGENVQFLHRYLFSTMRGLKCERLIAIFADDAGYVIKEEILADGSDSNLAFSPRLIFKRALALDCRRLLIAHNHPSGCSEPSAIDIEHTARLVHQARELGICVADHLIIGRHSVVSMRQRGLL